MTQGTRGQGDYGGAGCTGDQVCFFFFEATNIQRFFYISVCLRDMTPVNVEGWLYNEVNFLYFFWPASSVVYIFQQYKNTKIKQFVPGTFEHEQGKVVFLVSSLRTGLWHQSKPSWQQPVPWHMSTNIMTYTWQVNLVILGCSCNLQWMIHYVHKV